MNNLIHIFRKTSEAKKQQINCSPSPAAAVDAGEAEDRGDEEGGEDGDGDRGAGRGEEDQADLVQQLLLLLLIVGLR